MKTNDELEEMIVAQGSEMRELKAAISVALNSSNAEEIKKGIKRALSPYWQSGTFKKEVQDWADGKYAD